MSGGWPQAPELPGDPDEGWAVIRRRSQSLATGERAVLGEQWIVLARRQ